MKKNRSSGLLALCLALCLACSLALPVQAEELLGESGWKVSFTSDNKMESSFKTGDLDEAVMGMQPGDSILFTISLENGNSKNTDWYMSNQVISSLEDSSENASGGAYTYELAYTDKDGARNVLFRSDTVGGDRTGQAGEGLNAAANGLGDFFYLDRLQSGQKGTVTLKVALDGETQGNGYQDTLADLEMNFAVELPEDNAPEPGANPGNNPGGNPGGGSGDPGNSGHSTGTVKTGDENNLIPYVAALGISGILFLLLAIYSLRRGRREREEA